MKYQFKKFLAFLMTIAMILQIMPMPIASAAGLATVDLDFPDDMAKTNSSGKTIYIVVDAGGYTAKSIYELRNGENLIDFSSNSPVSAVFVKLAYSPEVAASQSADGEVVACYPSDAVPSIVPVSWSYDGCDVSISLENGIYSISFEKVPLVAGSVEIQLNLSDKDGQPITEMPTLQKDIFVMLQKSTNSNQGIIQKLEWNNEKKAYCASINQIFTGINNDDVLIDVNSGDIFNVSLLSPRNTVNGSTLKPKYDEFDILTNGTYIADKYVLDISDTLTTTASDTSTPCIISANELSDKVFIAYDANNQAFYTANISSGNSANVSSIMSYMLNYGIVANVWIKNGNDSETSMAVGELRNVGGGQNGSNSSKSLGSDVQYWMVEEVTRNRIQVKGYHVILTCPDSVYNEDNLKSTSTVGNNWIHNGINESENLAMITHESVEPGYVQGKVSSFLTQHAAVQANTLATQHSITEYGTIRDPGQNFITIDISHLDDGATYYFDVASWPILSRAIQDQTGGLTIHKKEGQKNSFQSFG